ncbi:MAG TPA: acyl--CoA ligase [Candidatus Acidoferrales bacterium]|nr:acyl--CoA ligase [Candidatus Acidoferrales bacterium]
MSELSQLLTRHVQEQPERTAVGTSDGATVISYGELDALVRSAMAQLSRLGLNRGATIALVSDNCAEFVIGLLAVVSTGARVAPLNPALTLSELSTRLSELSAHAVLAPKHLASKLESAEAAAGSAAHWIMSVESSGGAFEVRIADRNGQSHANGAAEKTRTPIDGEDVALLMFTAGTTSASKVVPLTHRNVVASVRGISCGYELSPQDATLIVMPLFHGHGLVAGLLATLASGGSAYLPSTGGFSAHLFWGDVVRLGVTWYTAVPTIHRILVNRASNDYPSSAPTKLRFIRSCSAPLDEELAAAITATFRAPLISAYGMTEASHQVSSNPLPVHGPDKTSSVGLPTGVEIRIVADDGRDVATGSVGEILVRGATVTTGYLNNPEANSASFVDGWFRSGDLGSVDADGYLYVRGRLKEIINRGGEKISPGDIDAVLLSNPKVLDAESFGESDAIYGENVQAAVILRAGMKATEDELRDYCRTKLSVFEVPERIHIVSDFPRTAKGSTDRRALAEQFTAGDSTLASGRENTSPISSHAGMERRAKN